MKAIWKTLCAAAMVAMSAMPGLAADKTIKMGTMAWEDLTPITGITRKVLEDKGYTVEVTTFSEWGIAYAALSKGDVQLLASQTDYVAQDYWMKNRKRLEKISPVSHGLYDGIAVPDYVGITSIEELNAHADKFGGKIIGIEPGAGLMRETATAIKDYDLKLELVEGSTAAMTAAVKSAVDRKDWIAVSSWQPFWMMDKFHMRFLEDPKGAFPPPQSYYWIAQKGFSAENPEAREIVASIYLPLEDISAINVAVGDGKPMDQAIADWIAANGDRIARWEDAKQ